MDDILDNSPDITTEYVESFLSNMQYPVDLADIVHFAMMARAPQNILDILNGLTPGVYHSFQELDFYLRKYLQQ